MIIKSLKKKREFKTNLFFKLYFFVSLIFLLIFSGIFFNSGYWKQIKNPFLDRYYNSGVNNYIKIFQIKYYAILSNFYQLDEIELNLSFKNVLKLENERNEALSRDKFAGGSSFQFTEVPASINLKKSQNNIKVKLRLKGDRNIHFDKESNTSYKINVTGEDTLFGLRKFSLMKPRARNYVHEWIFHELLGEGNLIKLKYDFLNLKLNGMSHGLYVMEEGFDKILLERNERRNGPIFSLHEEFSTEINNTKFEVYNKNYWTSPENIELTKIASAKLKILFDGNQSINGIIDEEKWAWYFAVADINNYYHGLLAKSVKFYYNPISTLIEPIGFDGHRTLPNFSKNFVSWESKLNRSGPNSFELAKKCQKKDFDKKCIDFVQNFFFNADGSVNQVFYDKYRKAVLKVSSKTFLDDFFSKNSEQIKIINSKIYSDYYLIDQLFYYGPGLYFFEKKDFYNMSKILNEYFENNHEKIFAVQDGEKLFFYNLSLNNDYKLLKIKCDEKNFNKNFRKKLIYSDFKPIEISLESIYKNKLNCSSYQIQDSISKDIILKKIDKVNSEIPKLNTINNEVYKKYFKNEGDKLLLKNKLTEINETIHIPENYYISLFPSEKIILNDNAFIFSKSPWIVVGEKNQEVEIRGEKDNFGGGIIVNSGEKKSFFKHVKFSYLTGQKKIIYNEDENVFYSSKTQYQDGKLNNFKEKIIKNPKINFREYIILGSINFYNTKVDLKDINFYRINSEDAINIISSEFEIKNINFDENGSDAIDLDFSNGKIDNVNFSNIGNDAIDFSGSNVEVNNANFLNVKDKIISVGENSDIKINEIVAVNSYVGITAKDGSKVLAKNIIMDEVKIPFASYIKKKEYKKPTLTLENVKVENYYTKWIKDEKSSIIYQNNTVGEKTSKILPIIYGRNIKLIQ